MQLNAVICSKMQQNAETPWQPRYRAGQGRLPNSGDRQKLKLAAEAEAECELARHADGARGHLLCVALSAVFVRCRSRAVPYVREEQAPTECNIFRAIGPSSKGSVGDPRVYPQLQCQDQSVPVGGRGG